VKLWRGSRWAVGSLNFIEKSKQRIAYWKRGRDGIDRLPNKFAYRINPEGFDVKNPVGTNLAYHLDSETTDGFVRAMASSLDLINIWSIFLLGIRFACTTKVEPSTAIIVVAVYYLVFKLITSGLEAL